MILRHLYALDQSKSLIQASRLCSPFYFCILYSKFSPAYLDYLTVPKYWWAFILGHLNSVTMSELFGCFEKIPLANRFYSSDTERFYSLLRCCVQNCGYCRCLSLPTPHPPTPKLVLLVFQLTVNYRLFWLKATKKLPWPLLFFSYVIKCLK